MSTINIKCIDQVLAFQNMPVITSGNQNVDKVQFDFCPLWDGFIKVAVFFQQKGELSYAIINADNSCDIPNSILKLNGKIYISVTGTNTNNQVRTSDILAYTVEPGIVNSSINDEFSSDISDEEKNDVYHQILELCSNIQTLYQELANNSAYVRISGANTFSYEESQLEAKIHAYTYSKSEIDEAHNKFDTGIANLDKEINTLKIGLDDTATQLRGEFLTRINAVMSELNNLETYIKDEVNRLDQRIGVLENA